MASESDRGQQENRSKQRARGASDNEENRRGDQRDNDRTRAANSAADGSMTISTDDPIVRSDVDRPRDPRGTYAFETSPAEPADADLSRQPVSRRDVVERQAPSRYDDGGANGRRRYDEQDRSEESESALRRRSEQDRRRDRLEGDDDRDDSDDDRSRPRERSRQSNSNASSSWAAHGWKGMLITAIVALVCGAAGAWAYSEFFGSSKSDQDKSSQKSGGSQGGKSGSSKSGGSGGASKSGGSSKKSGGGSGGHDESGDSASQIPGFTSADDADTLKKQLKHLASRVDALNNRIDELKKPKNETPPVLHTLQMQMAELSRTVDEVGKLPAHVRQLDHRLSSLVEQFKTLRDDVEPDADSVSPAPIRVNPVLPKADPNRASRLPETTDEEGDVTMELGIDLFKAGRYAQAREVFRRLQNTLPNDASVWYYSALANGLITHAWDGETKRLFERGAARERAGTPEKAQIDQTMTAKMPEEARRELDKYRRQAVTDNADQIKTDGSQQYQLNNDSLNVP